MKSLKNIIVNTRAYDEEAAVFMKNTKRVENPYRYHGGFSVCESAIYLKYADAVKYFKEYHYNKSGQCMIIPFLYHVLRCKCHGITCHCRKCGAVGHMTSVDLYRHACKCNNFGFKTYVTTHGDGGAYSSTKISESGYNNLYVPIIYLISACPQITALKINYEVIGPEYVGYLIHDDRSVKLSSITRVNKKILYGNNYVMLGTSFGFAELQNKLVEQLAACIRCGKYYDSFPDFISVIRHLSSQCSL